MNGPIEPHSHRHERASPRKPRYEVAVPDQFDLLTAEAGTRAQAPAGVASWASRPPRIAGDVVAGSALTSCRVGDA